MTPKTTSITDVAEAALRLNIDYFVFRMKMPVVVLIQIRIQHHAERRFHIAGRFRVGWWGGLRPDETEWAKNEDRGEEFLVGSAFQ